MQNLFYTHKENLMSDQEQLSPQDELAALVKKLRQSRKKALRRLEKQLKEKEEAARWPQLRHTGDTILTHKNEIQRGMKSFETADVHTAAPLTIKLNPKCNAVRNAELYYKKAKKGERGHAACVEKVARTREDIAADDELLKRAEEALSQENLSADEAHALAQEIRPRLKSVPSSGRKKTQEKSLPYRRYEYRGWTIYAGKTAKINDELSTRFAKPSDIWLHAVGYAGSHVIIRRKKNTPWPPPEIIDTAGGIAVFFSKAKHTSYAEVHITEARFVRKPRKSPPGLVVADRCKTKRVTPVDPQQLFRST
ncbi:MAG: NFACT RNA binding domain-containing protein [Fibrobacterota bacterium]